jgi:hypothetical protein
MAKTLIALIAALCIAFPAFAAQSRTAQKKEAKPAWTELSTAQQQILAPLAGEWNDLDTTRRRKWVAIANRYPKMKPQEQLRLQKRMKEWVALTPEQRRVAREKYQTVQKLPTAKRKDVRQQWKEYQQSLAAQPEISPSDPPAPPDTAAPETPAAAPATATPGATPEQ